MIRSVLYDGDLLQLF